MTRRNGVVHTRQVTVRHGTIKRTPWWQHRFIPSVGDIVIAIGLFLIAFNANRDMIGVTAFHPDETRWLNRAYYVEDLADPYGSTWQDYYLTRGQPPLGSYAIGIGQWVQGMSMHPNLVWDFFYIDSNWNQIAGGMPDEENLEAGRNTSAFIGGLAVVAAYFVARLLTNPVGGFVAAFMLAWNGLSIRIGSQSLSDQTLLFTLGLTFLAAIMFMRRPNWFWAVALGATFGLGGAAKLTPLLLSLAAAGLGGVLLLRWIVIPLSKQERRLDRSMAIKLLVQPIIAFVTFVLVYPYLWVDPIGRSWKLYDFRIQEMESQGDWLKKANVDGILPTFERISRANNLGVTQQTTWKFTQWLADWFDTTMTLRPGLDLMLAAAALPFVLALAVKFGIRGAHLLVTMLLGAETALIIIGLRTDLYRYYLPLVLIMFICVGVMAGVIASWLGEGLSGWWVKPAPKRIRYGKPQRIQTRVVRFRTPWRARRSLHQRLA